MVSLCQNRHMFKTQIVGGSSQGRSEGEIQPRIGMDALHFRFIAEFKKPARA